MLLADGSGWNPRVLEALRIPEALLPEIVDSSGVVGSASALAGAPIIAGLAGDQQASLIGQGCTRPGQAKATFGTGGMLDQCLGADPPGRSTCGPAGTIPIIAWRRKTTITWGLEAIMLSAGTCVEWLRDDLGILESAEQSAEVAARCDDTGDVWFVPALLGLGTPVWDFGARGTVLGLTRGSGRPELGRGSSKASRTEVRTCCSRRSPTRACRCRRCGSTVACPPTRSSPARSPTLAGGRSRSHR